MGTKERTRCDKRTKESYGSREGDKDILRDQE